jgi:hypothetical protein
MTILVPRPRGIWESFLPSQLQVAPVLLPRAEMLRGIFGALPRSAWQVTFLCQDPLYSPFGGMSHKSMAISLTAHALTMNIDSRGDFNDYWESRSRKLRQNIRRYKSRVKKDGINEHLDQRFDSREMRQSIKRFGALETSGWKGREGTAVSIDNVQGAFYLEVLEKFAATNQAKVYEYYLGDTLAASRLLIQGPKINVALKTTYDERRRSYSPGRVLLYEILRREIREDSSKDSIEFYTNATKDQLQWSSDERWINHVSLFRNKFFLAIQKLAALRHKLGRRR